MEVVQSIHDAPMSECPACGGTLRKVFGNVGVVFKGSGFYRTDNRGKPKSRTASEPAKAGAAKAESAAGSASAAASADTAPAAGSQKSDSASSAAGAGSGSKVATSGGTKPAGGS
jgi:putative FmdB family regulatory protein